MAYPTTLNFKPLPQFAVPQGIADTSTTQLLPLGTKVRAVDATYGEAEFIYLKGVASTAAGDAVIYDGTAGTTTRAVAASFGPVAIAMSANVASQYGWYCVSGCVPVNTTAAGTGAANNRLKTTATAGQLTVSGTSAQKVDGARCNTAQDTAGGGSAAGFTDVQLAYPSSNGNT